MRGLPTVRDIVRIGVRRGIKRHYLASGSFAGTCAIGAGESAKYIIEGVILLDENHDMLNLVYAGNRLLALAQYSEGAGKEADSKQCALRNRS
jgi:hypothetical protein